MDLVTILAIGPRDLPKDDMVEVRFDVGSGSGGGQRLMVPVRRLTLSDRDSGEGQTALYEYELSKYRE